MTSPVATMDVLDWDQFVERYWDRQPVLIASLPEPPFEAGEVFQAAVRGTHSHPPEIMPPNVQFTVGRHQQVEPADWFPEPSDGSLPGYEKRITQQLPNGRYAFVVHSFHSFAIEQWRRECAFYSGLWDRVGIPLTGAITTMFHGNYEHSHVGVHIDRFATFMYALVGRKRMRFWRQRPWSEPVSTVLDYQPYLDTSFTVDVEPGQLLYWPATYYHVGESDLSDQPATSVNVGVPRHEHRAAYDVEDVLLDATPEALLAGAVDDLADVPETGLVQAGTDLDAAPPAALARALSVVAQRCRPELVRDRVAVLSLRRWTGGGLLPAPPPAQQRSLADAATVRAVAPVIWANGGTSRFCAANGQVARTALPPERVNELVTRLRSGEPLPVAKVGEDAHPLLAALESFHALAR